MRPALLAAAATAGDAAPEKLQSIEDSACGGCCAVDGEQIVCDSVSPPGIQGADALCLSHQ